MKFSLERVDTLHGSQLWLQTTIWNSSRRIHGPVKFIIDTGAMHTVIAYDQAVRLGFNVGSLKEVKKCRGISEEINAYPIRNNIFYIKGKDENDKDALFKTPFDIEIVDNPGRGLFNLLGLDFLITKNARLIIDFENNDNFIEMD
ncbi:MAG: aspartyl protease family protein [Candidatus Thermoplasmatota archaeon]|nr:aspartyl protease family protein [Candidatus Thermoplasmatota archaeon]